jgi:signal recognition particle receptor subunit beta
VRLDPDKRELAIKLVYYGPPESGKTTNLQKLHARAEAHNRGRMLTLDTQADRTLFFDLLPLHFRAGDMVVQIRVYTVPGQVSHNATRKVVLKDADGIAFVADSRLSETEANNAAFANLKENLRENGLDPEDIPLVVQWNKRDLPGVRSDEEIARLATPSRPVLGASALRDEGVLKTFFTLVELTWDDLDRRHELSGRHGLARAELLARVGALFGKRL